MTENAARVGHFHAVQFYDTSESMHLVVSKFMGEGLLEGQPALILAMPEDHPGILTALRNGYIDVESARLAGDFLLLDASEILSRVMVGGMPDARLFNTVTTGIIEQLLHGRQDRSVRAFGGMVSYLWSTGNVAAALSVEKLWNLLALTHPFSLLCGYSLGAYENAADTAGIYQQHSQVLGPQSPLWLSDGADCPECGTPLSPGPRSDVVYRCESCGVELIDFADAHEFVVHHLQAKASARLSREA